MLVSAPLFRLVYRSQAADSFRPAELPDMLQQARLSNQQLQLSGLLLYAAGEFMQVLEGPEPALRELYARIKADRRHTQVRTLAYEPIVSRAFPDWRMGFAPVGAAVLQQATGFLELAAAPGLTAHPPQALWQLLRSFAQLDQPDA